MAKVLRLIAIFATIYLVSGVAISITLPHLMAWQFANCQSESMACSASSAFLSYWWLALLPFLLVATLFIDRAIARRAA